MKTITISTPDSGDSACVNPLKGSVVFQGDLISPVVPPPRDSDAGSIIERLGLPPGVEDVELEDPQRERTFDKGGPGR
jgi:hypothetical protein